MNSWTGIMTVMIPVVMVTRIGEAATITRTIPITKIRRVNPKTKGSISVK